MEPIMKTSLLFLVLCSALLHNTTAKFHSSEEEDDFCCYKDTRTRIPLYLLESYYWTGENCRRERIVFVTVSQRQICVNPKAPWVQRAIEYIENNNWN